MMQKARDFEGKALVNKHPDYLKSKPNRHVYYEFLIKMKKRDHTGHALPRDVAQGLHNHAMETLFENLEMGPMVITAIADREIAIYPQKDSSIPIYERSRITENKTINIPAGVAQLMKGNL